MKVHDDIEQQAGRLRRLLESRLGVRGRDLEQALRKARGYLPRSIRAQGQRLVDAQKRAGNPKLARQLNHAELTTAFDKVAAHLRTIDAADRRKGRILTILAVIAFNVLLVMVAFIVWLWWQGYV